MAARRVGRAFLAEEAVRRHNGHREDQGQPPQEGRQGVRIRRLRHVTRHVTRQVTAGPEGR